MPKVTVSFYQDGDARKKIRVCTGRFTYSLLFVLHVPHLSDGLLIYSFKQEKTLICKYWSSGYLPDSIIGPRVQVSAFNHSSGGQSVGLFDPVIG